MITLSDLQHWELIVLSGVLAVTALSVVSVFGFSLAFLLMREPAAHGVPHVVAGPTGTVPGADRPAANHPAMAAG